jgi:hypothetical protein
MILPNQSKPIKRKRSWSTRSLSTTQLTPADEGDEIDDDDEDDDTGDETDDMGEDIDEDSDEYASEGDDDSGE